MKRVKKQNLPVQSSKSLFLILNKALIWLFAAAFLLHGDATHGWVCSILVLSYFGLKSYHRVMETYFDPAFAGVKPKEEN